MSVTVAQQSHAPLGTLTSASFSSGGRQVSGAEPATYLATISPSDHLSSALYNRDHSSPVDSPAYPCGGSEQRATAANAAASPESPSSSTQNTDSLPNDAPNTNNGATSKIEFSNMYLSDTKKSASIPKRDTGASSLQNTSTVSGAAGLSDDSDQSKFDLESFMRNFPKSAMSFPERVPIQDFSHRFNDMLKSNNSMSNSSFQKPASPEPEPRRAALSAANETPSDKTQEAMNNDNDDGSGDKEDQESDEDKALYNSQLALRLKSTIQSEFLSNELFPGSKSETSTRTIDDIMRDYGIKTQAYKQSQFLSSAGGTINVSGNNESVKPLEPFSLSCHGSTAQNISLTEKPHAMQNPLNASKDFIARNVSTEKSSSGTSQLKSVNFSQNNETDTGLQQQYDTKSFGTCVDMTLSALASKYQSTSRTASSYNTALDKSAPFSGDISFQASNDYKMYDGQAPKAATSYSKYSSSEFGGPKESATTGLGNELSGSYSPTRSNNFRLYSQLGAADALGFSLQAEKQRLRNIDAMIATTPLTTRYNELKPYKFTTSSSFVASDFDSKRHYSTPALGATTTYPYRNEINLRVGWSAGVTQSTMGKSVSAPTYEYNRGVTSTGSSVDSQYYASRDGGSGRNYQYNNCTYVDKSIADKMLNVRDATASLKKKADHGFKAPPKASTPSVGRGSPTRIALARPISANNVKICKQSTAGKKKMGAASAPRACVAGRKKINTNESKMMHTDAFSEFDFVKDLSKKWQHSIQNMEPKITPKPQKYHPYKPVSVDEKKMQDMPGATADHGCINNHKLSDKSRNSWSPNFDHGSLLDMESSMAKWCRSVVQNKSAPTKQKSVSGAKSYTSASYSGQQPKSILKNMCSKSALTRSNTTITQSRTGPKSSTTTSSSKAYHVTTAQMFAGLAFKMKAQNKPSPASPKPKSAKKRSKTPLV